MSYREIHQLIQWEKKYDNQSDYKPITFLSHKFLKMQHRSQADANIKTMPHILSDKKAKWSIPEIIVMQVYIMI